MEIGVEELSHPGGAQSRAAAPPALQRAQQILLYICRRGQQKQYNEIKAGLHPGEKALNVNMADAQHSRRGAQVG